MEIITSYSPKLGIWTSLKTLLSVWKAATGARKPPNKNLCRSAPEALNPNYLLRWIVSALSCHVRLCVGGNGCWGFDMYMALNERATTPPWVPFSPSRQQKLVRSTNYKLKCHPPEVSASIRLEAASWGQLMAAASPTGSRPPARVPLPLWFLFISERCKHDYQPHPSRHSLPPSSSDFLQPLPPCWLSSAKYFFIFLFLYQTPTFAFVPSQILSHFSSSLFLSGF